MFDGKVASTKKNRTESQKKFGIQLDSLSDLVCFGILPVAIGYSVGLTNWYFIPFLGLFVLAALIRLAYFNVMEEQRQKETSETRKSYNGMPVTTVSGLLPLIYCFRVPTGDYFRYIYFAALMIFGLAFLLKKLTIKKAGGRLLILISILGALILAAVVALMFLK